MSLRGLSSIFRISAALMAFCTPAMAANVVLMINMNYSSDELRVLQAQADARGQRVEMVPPKSMIALVEPLFKARDEIQEDISKQLPNTDPLKIKSALSSIMRHGATWNGDPEITSIIGQEKMTKLFNLAQKVNSAERQAGEIYDQLQRKAAELKAKGDKVDTMVISTHSDGSNLTGETSNKLSANQLAKLKLEQPEIFSTPRHVLLLGCYNMTKPNHRAWRYDLFPRASMIAGFGIKAPSRFDPTSTGFITQTLSTADRLDREMVAAGKALDPAYLDKTFKGLNSFTTTTHPGVIDYCYTMVEGQPDTWNRDCDVQWKDIYEKKRKMEAYWSLRNPKEDPPSISGGELRMFYNTLQSACPAQDAKSEKDDWKNSERMRVTLREMTIRLIFWWNVQHNFSTYFDNDLSAMSGRLRAAGVFERIPKLDGTTTRIEFVGFYNSVSSQLRDSDPALYADFRSLLRPLFLLKGEDTVAPGEKVSTDETLERGAIPFNWIEGATVMRKR